MALTYGKVGVIGAGVMGRGLAQALLQTDHQVVLIDVSQAILDEAVREVGRAIRIFGVFDGNARVAEPAKVIQRLATSTDYSALGGVDFVVENATEDWTTKEAVYQALDRHCAPSCVLAANTSAISIARLAAIVSNPSRVIGMHFMNPVPMKRVVEVIRSQDTSAATIDAAHKMLDQMNKSAIVVNDSPGFVTNRVLMLTINEAISVVEEGVSNAKDVDAIFVGCFSHAMGPLATADLIGLDTILRSLEVLQSSLGDQKFKPSGLLIKMVDSGQLGKKSGSGFFQY